MSDLSNELKRIFREGDALTKLIASLLIVFLLVLFLNIYSALFKNNLYDAILGLLVLPSNATELLIKPWTLFSYMFIHQNFLHILFNLLYLYFAGRIFSEFLGSEKLIHTFLIGGFAGGILYVLSYNIFPLFNDIVNTSSNRGASAGVMSILVASATMAPNLRIKLFMLFDVKLWIVVLLLIIIDLAYLPIENAGGHIAHLGGAIYGYFMASYWKKNMIDIGGFLPKLISKINSLFIRRSSLKIVHRKKQAIRKTLTPENSRLENQKELDRILEKISQSGYASLNKEEKDFLFRMSNK